MFNEEFDAPSSNVDLMTVNEVCEYHERMCEESDGWSHGFEWCSHSQLGRAGYPKLAVVELFVKENWAKMGDTLNMRADYGVGLLDLSGCGLTEESIAALFGRNRTFEFRALYLHGNPFGPSGVAALIPFLRSTSMLKYLNLNRTSLDSEGARLLSEALNHVRLEHLHLDENDIEDEGLEYLLSAGNSANLLRLSLWGNEIGSRGCAAMSNFLQRDGIMLEKLCIDCVRVEDAKMLVDSISYRSKLVDLHFCASGEQIMMVAPNLLGLVCNLSSFEAMCRSHHQLRGVGKWTRKILTSDPTLKGAFDINARSLYGTSVIQRLRSKLRTFYFQGNFDVRPFIGIDAVLLPKVLELVTRMEVCLDQICLDDLGSGRYCEAPSENIDGVYRLVRNYYHLGELFSFPSQESKVKDLEAKVAALEVDNAQVQRLKEENANLRLKIEQLTLENERSKSSVLLNR